MAETLIFPGWTKETPLKAIPPATPVRGQDSFVLMSNSHPAIVDVRLPGFEGVDGVAGQVKPNLVNNSVSDIYAGEG